MIVVTAFPQVGKNRKSHHWKINSVFVRRWRGIKEEKILLSTITQVDQFDFTTPSSPHLKISIVFCYDFARLGRGAQSLLYLLHHLRFWDTIEILIETTPLYGISCSHGIRVWGRVQHGAFLPRSALELLESCEYAGPWHKACSSDHEKLNLSWPLGSTERDVFKGYTKIY